MKFACWITLLTASSTDKVIAAVIKAGYTTKFGNKVIDNDRPCSILNLTLEKDIPSIVPLTALDVVAVIRDDIGRILEEIGVLHYGVIITEHVNSSWLCSNILLSKQLAARKTRITKAPHLSLVPSKPTDDQPKEPS